jgi:predicted RNase H-like HicB family nuclease
MDYPIVIMPLSEEDGGGFVGLVPDLLGCVGDGSSREEAARDTESAIAEWLSEAKRLGREIPQPGAAAERFRDERKALIETVKLLAHDNISLETIVDDLESKFEILMGAYEQDSFRLS